MPKPNPPSALSVDAGGDAQPPEASEAEEPAHTSYSVELSTDPVVPVVVPGLSSDADTSDTSLADRPARHSRRGGHSTVTPVSASVPMHTTPRKTVNHHPGRSSPSWGLSPGAPQCQGTPRPRRFAPSRPHKATLTFPPQSPAGNPTCCSGTFSPRPPTPFKTIRQPVPSSVPTWPHSGTINPTPSSSTALISTPMRVPRPTVSATLCEEPWWAT